MAATSGGQATPAPEVAYRGRVPIPRRLRRSPLISPQPMSLAVEAARVC
jgi:hypothetical protein